MSSDIKLGDNIRIVIVTTVGTMSKDSRGTSISGDIMNDEGRLIGFYKVPLSMCEKIRRRGEEITNADLITELEKWVKYGGTGLTGQILHQYVPTTISRLKAAEAFRKEILQLVIEDVPHRYQKRILEALHD